MKNINNIYLLLFICSFIFSIDSHHLSNQDYFTGDDGVIRMNVNIMGHVKSPGSFVVYDGIDILTALSLAGGYLPGSDLKNINIYNIDGNSCSINLKSILNQGLKIEDKISLKPHDTIYIEQKKISQIFTSSNIPSIFLNILNIALTINRTD